jgi:hypothetical protein
MRRAEFWVWISEPLFEGGEIRNATLLRMSGRWSTEEIARRTGSHAPRWLRIDEKNATFELIAGWYRGALKVVWRFPPGEQPS